MAIFTESAKENDLYNVNESIMALAIYSEKKITNRFPEDFDYYSFDGEIIAIGDDYNDIDFLKNTPFSYTLDYVTNEAVREVCNFSVESVADLIEKFVEGI